VRPLVVIDADVLGRQRTGDETYVENLLRLLPAAGGDFRFAAITRHPELVPEDVEPIHVATGSQELRMARSVPRVLRRLRPALAHFQHALPLWCPCPAVVTIHDLSFERDPRAMSRRDRFVFRRVVPRAVRKARCVIAVSERTKRDLVDLYGVPPDRIAVTPHGVDPAFGPGHVAGGGYLLYVGAVQARKDPLAAAREAALRVVAAAIAVLVVDVDDTVCARHQVPATWAEPDEAVAQIAAVIREAVAEVAAAPPPEFSVLDR